MGDHRAARRGRHARELDAIDASATSPATPNAAPPPRPVPLGGVDGHAATMASTPGVRPPPAAPSRGALGCVVAGVAASLALGGIGIGAFIALRPPSSRSIDTPSFTFEVPGDWEEIAGGGAGLVSQYGAPHDATEGGTRTQMFVSRTPYAGTTEMVATAGAQLGVQNGGTIERNIPAALAGRPAREVEIAYPYIEGSYVQAQRATVVDGEAWVVGCTGQQSRFEAIRPTCRAIFDSFRLR